MSEFLHRELSEKEKEEIKIKAKSIMNSFAKKLEKVNVSNIEDAIVERGDCEREEDKSNVNEIDKDMMFENAHDSKNGFIVAEKGGWTK